MKAEAIDIIKIFKKFIEKIPNELSKNLNISQKKAKEEVMRYGITISVEAVDDPNDYCEISNVKEEEEDEEIGYSEEDDEIEFGADYREDQLMSEGDVKKYFKKIKPKKEDKKESKEKESNISENFTILEKILKICNQKNNQIIEKWTDDIKKENKKLFKKNNFDNQNIIAFLEEYCVNISKIENVKQFLQLLKYAFDKKQIVYKKNKKED